ncbi:unnamed protein product [Victoria cruziana]
MSCPYTPQQNGIAERKHRHIIETALSMMHDVDIPFSFWTEAFYTATYVINRLPMVLLNDKSPYFVLHGQHPAYYGLHPFGCICYVHIDSSQRHKFQDKAMRCKFLGYADGYKGYRCYNCITGKIHVSRNVVFDDKVFEKHVTDGVKDVETYDTWLSSSLLYDAHTDSTRNDESIHEIRDENEPVDMSEDAPSIHPPPRFFGFVYGRRGIDQGEPSVRRSERIRHPIDRWVSYKNFSLDFQVFLSNISKDMEPTFYQEAAQSQAWIQAMNEEINALHECGTWEIVPQPRSKNVVGSKWVYKIKYKPDGSIQRHKARLIARGFSQKYEQDYEETFSPVVKMGTIRIVLSLALQHGWSLSQLDVKNAFLHGELKEEVYMEQPPGYTEHDSSKWVCKLRRSLYGLKQASRSWFESFSTEIKQHGFNRSILDHFMFIFKNSSTTTWVLIYVDDIIITENDTAHIDWVKAMLMTKFKMKDLGPLRYFLGIEVDYKDSTLTLSQHKYVLDILYRTSMENCKAISTSCLLNHKMSSKEGEPFYDPTLFRSIVGMLQYLTFTRPDIVFSVNQVSQFMHAPTNIHMEAVKRILRYLKGTLNDGLVYSKDDQYDGGHRLVTYTDADWAGDPDERRSVSGYCVFIGHNAVVWSSKKQRAIARSSAEAEYRAMAAGVADVTWVRHLLEELSESIFSSIFFCDNQSAINIARNPILHCRTKHIEIDQHFVRQKVEDKEIEPAYIRYDSQIADVFTKGLTAGQFWALKGKLYMIENHAQLEGGC